MVRIVKLVGVLHFVFFSFFVFVAFANASVPTSYGTSQMQRTALEEDRRTDWCTGTLLDGDVNRYQVLSTTTDANGYFYYYINNTFDFVATDQSDSCDNKAPSFQLPSQIGNRSQDWKIYMIVDLASFSNPSSACWIESDGDDVCYSLSGESVENYSFGGEDYSLYNLGSTSGLATSSGNLGLLTDINFSTISTGRVYALLYSNVDLMQISNAVEMKQYMDNLFGFIVAGGEGGGVVIPEEDTDYIILTQPAKESGKNYSNTTYNVNFSGLMNFASSTPEGCSWIVSFTSQTGIPYASKEVRGTSETCEVEPFSGSVSFALDDVVYVTLASYDNTTWSGLPTVLSRRYEWWVSQTGDPTSDVDLGTFTTGTTTCGVSAANASWFDFGYGLCVAGQFLFLPSQSSLEYMKTRVAFATATVPFSYIYDSSNYFEQLLSPATTSWAITMPTSTPVFGGMVLLSSSIIESLPPYDIIRLAETAVVYILLPLYVWRRRGAILGDSGGSVDMGTSHTLDMRRGGGSGTIDMRHK